MAAPCYQAVLGKRKLWVDRPVVIDDELVLHGQLANLRSHQMGGSIQKKSKPTLYVVVSMFLSIIPI